MHFGGSLGRRGKKGIGSLRILRDPNKGIGSLGVPIKGIGTRVAEESLL